MKYSTKLFGVDNQRQQLIDSFESCLDCKCSEPKVLSIISGPSGSGKTVLAHTLQDKAKYLLIGKCDQFQKGAEPLGPFIAALSVLAQDIFREDSQTVLWYQSRAQQAIHEETEIHLLLDSAPAMAKFFPCTNWHHHNTSVSTTSTIQRSNTLENPTIHVICKFLRCICSTYRSIVLIIDDIQWIDSSSLELFQHLASQGKSMAGFMLLCTCRDDEVNDDHPFSVALNNLEEKKNISINKIQLKSLSVKTVSELAVDKFPTLAGHTLDALSTVIHKHTNGNAFFTTQVLHRLESSGWKAPVPKHDNNEKDDWNSANERSMIGHLASLEYDTLVQIVVSDTANELPFMREVMASASCLGTDFEESHIMSVVNDSTTEEQVRQALSIMEMKDFIRPHRDGLGWGWAHDKFQEAAYMLIDTDQRKLFHLAIGRRLLKALPKEELWRYLFIVVSQFSIALSNIKDETEAEKVISLFLQAGEKSAQSSSFSKAASYLSMGMSLLRADNWESQYDLSVKVYSAAAEMECCRGNFVEADKLVTVILRQTRSIQDQLRAYEIKIHFLSAKEEHYQAICLALDVMDKLGEKFPRKPGMPKIVFELMSTKWQLSRRSVDDVLALKPMTDWKKLAILRISQAIFPTLARAGNQQLMPIIICRSIKLSLKYGLSGLACYNFMAMSLALMYPLGYMEESDKCVAISKRVLEEFGVEDFMKCRIGLMVNVFHVSFKAPLRDTLEPFEKLSSVGLVTGDISMACISLRGHAMMMLICGESLDKVKSLTRKYLNYFQDWRQPAHYASLLPLMQLLENLTSETKDDCCTFTGNLMNEEDWIVQTKMSNDDFRMIVFLMYKAFFATYLGKYKKAKEWILNLMKINLSSAGAILFQIFFLDALIGILLVREKSPGSGSRGGVGKAKHYKSSLKKLRFYGKDVPANVNSKIWLIEAELAVLKHGRCNEAISKFHQSAEEAKRQGIIQEEAYAHERYATAMLEWGEITEALEYFERAINLYEEWGSSVKVIQLVKYVHDKSGMKMTIRN